MKLLFSVVLITLINITLSAQQKTVISTGIYSGPFTMPKLVSSSEIEMHKPMWHISFQSMPNEAEEDIFHLEELKKLKMSQKMKSIENGNTMPSFKKTRASNPTIGVNFNGNALNSFTPNDNSIAVSNGGKIVSCINEGIAYYDTLGNTLMSQITWTDFVNDASLNQGKYDPRVIYDKLNDRFIVVLLHGYSSSTTKVLVSFSKTNNPLDGWNNYALSGNPYNDTTWTDYPTIGISDSDLFINGNRFGDAPTYNWKETYIYQIGLADGYAGTALNFGLWHQIQTPDGNDGITLYPASHGAGEAMPSKMYFVQLMPDSGSHVYLYELNGSLNAASKTLTASQYAIPHFETCANALEKDPTTGAIDSLSTGAAWTANAFYNNKVVHFSFCADIASGWCGVHYGRIFLDSNKATVTNYGQAGTDLCYPAIAYFGYDSSDQSAILAYERSDTLTLPETGILSIDNAMTWSNMQTVKAGDTSVNILYPPSPPFFMPERWGDYTGMCRKYNSQIPQAWMAGGFGANALRKNSYGTWIAQIITNEVQPNAVIDINNQKAKAILYPNPAVDFFNLEFYNEKAGHISIDIFDMQGRLIKNLLNDFLGASNNQISFNKLMLPAGNYLLRVSRNKLTTHDVKFSVVK